MRIGDAQPISSSLQALNEQDLLRVPCDLCPWRIWEFAPPSVSWAPLVGYGIDAWGVPSVLSALGILFSIAFVFLLVPLVLSPADRLKA